jgi:diguanylate cyclase (GGDEF)-like protein
MTTETLPPLHARVLTADNLPSLPTVAIKVLELTEQSDVSTAKIAQVVQNDPAMSAKILKLANSSMFGMAKKVVSLQQAMVLLGLRTVKIMVLSFSLVDTLSSKKKSAFDFSRYWRRSISMAVSAKLLADTAENSRRDEAFVGGLLADIGMVAAFRCAPDVYLPVVEKCAESKVPIQEVEKSLLGESHAPVSAALLRHWHLPELLCDAIAAHHGEGFEELQGRTRLAAGLLWSAAIIADLFCGELASDELIQVKEKCVELTGIEESKLEAVLEAIDSHVNETASMFSLDIGQTTSYDELRARAVTQLAAASIESEISRVEAARREESARQQYEQISGQAEQLRRDAYTDTLTQLANRKSFDENVKRAIKVSQKSGSALGLIMLDVDHFKKLNDDHGHQAGDESLREVGRCLNEVANDRVQPARYGGEEFAVIIENADPRHLLKVAEQIRVSIEQIDIKFEGKTIQFTASMGLAFADFAKQKVTSNQLIQRADACLYKAKENGRNRIEFKL